MISAVNSFSSIVFRHQFETLGYDCCVQGSGIKDLKGLTGCDPKLFCVGPLSRQYPSLDSFNLSPNIENYFTQETFHK